MKHLKLFEDFSQDIIKQYDPRLDITYVIDTKKEPKPGDKVLDIDGDRLVWREVEVYNIIGVIIEEVEGDPYNLNDEPYNDDVDDDVEVSNVQSPSTKFTKRTIFIHIPKVPEPEFKCIKEITLTDRSHKKIHVKVSDKIILNNYLYDDKSNNAKGFNVISVNGKKVDSWIWIEELTDNFTSV